ncbi:MAG: OB-fold nucleic acid binding domain-containing protein [Bacteroidales bacterium]|nr:OB-fold nucleic acid binding domain-containing protein [Bacteroidales bacterium]
MRLIFISISIIILISSCQGQDKKTGIQNSKDKKEECCPEQKNETGKQMTGSAMHEGVLQEAIQTNSYTYLRLKENNNDVWLAVPKMQADLGKTYYYKGGMEMKNFHSKELGRDFEVVIFLEKVALSPDGLKTPEHATDYTSNVKSTIVKTETKVEPVQGGITIAELFANKEKYAGKMVKIKGKITKYNKAIMKKNWIHIQDGTEYNGKFDVVATSNQEFTIGDVVTIEGKVALDKDFGYGYTYEILIEDAVKK